MDKLNTQQIITFLYADSTLDDRRRIQRVLTDIHKQARQDAKLSFRVGDLVEFFSERQHRTVKGKITRVMRVNVQMRDEMTGAMWRVTPTLLKKTSG